MGDMATIPTFSLWSPGDIPTAAQFNAQVRDAVVFFRTPPRCSVKKNSVSASIGPSTTGSPNWARLTWDNEDYDTDNMHGSPDYRLIAVTAGWYFVTCNILWSDFGTLQNGAHGIQIRKNSGGSATGGGRIAYDLRQAQPNITGDIGEGYQGCAGYATLAVNDYLEVFAAHGHDSFTGSDDSEVQHSITAGVRWAATWIAKV